MTTQFASASYQEVVDLHTESDTVSVIGIHTPQGDTPRKMFGGFFEQFKKFKYLGCSIKLVPAARLPADPLQVSYDAGEPTIDPRDMLNPLMFHGCHGNDMGVILNRLYALNSADRNSDSVDFVQNNIEWSLADIAEGKFPNFQLEELYYKALTDNTWKKAHPQRGFRKSGLRPLVYKMATNLQMLGTGQSFAGEVGVDGIPMSPDYESATIGLPVTQAGRQFFTPGLTGLGWLDTRNVLTDYKPVEIDLPITEEQIPDLEAAIRNATLAQQNASESSLPLVYMGMILLPPAYKTEQYFRMVINHHFAFKDFRGISFSNNLAVTPAYDNFNADETEDPDDPDPPTPPGPDPPLGASVILNRNIGVKYPGPSGLTFFDKATWDSIMNGVIGPDNVEDYGSLSVTGFGSGNAGVVFGFGVDADDYLRYFGCWGHNVNGEPKTEFWLYDKELDGFYPATISIVDNVLSFTITSQTSAGSLSTFTLNGMGADAIDTSGSVYSCIDTKVDATFNKESW